MSSIESKALFRHHWTVVLCINYVYIDKTFCQEISTSYRYTFLPKTQFRGVYLIFHFYLRRPHIVTNGNTSQHPASRPFNLVTSTQIRLSICKWSKWRRPVLAGDISRVITWRSGRPGNYRTNGSCMVPENSAETSEVLNSSMLYADNQLLSRAVVSLITGLEQTRE